MSYTKEEIENFEKKDLRINRVALLKSLFESGILSWEELHEVEAVSIVVEQYINYVYNGVKPTTCGSEAETEVNWEEVAKKFGVQIPTKQNIKILNLILDECKKNDRVIEPSTLMAHIINQFHKYPTSDKSVSVVLETLN